MPDEGRFETRPYKNHPRSAYLLPLGGVARAALLHLLDDFPVHREIVLEQRVGTDDVESGVLDTRQLAFGLDMRPGDVIARPREAPQRFECPHLRHPRRPREHPAWI